MKLNQKVVDGLDLPEEKKDVTHWDDECPGLAVRLQGKAKRWIIRYRVRGNPTQRQVTLGAIAGLSLRKAREQAVEYTSAAKRGIDLASILKAEVDEAQALLKSRAEGRFDVIVEKYIKHAETHLRPTTFKDLKRYLTVSWHPIHDRVITDLDTRQIIVHLEAMAVDNGPVAANRARSALSQCMSWAVTRGIIDRNPLIGTRAITVEKPRQRILSDDEIGRLWAETNRQGDYAKIVRLLLLTAQRREEIASIRWSEIDFDRGLWTIPENRTKNGRPHVVPLSEQVKAIIESQLPRPARDLVFGAGKGGFSGWGKCKERSDRRSSLTNWRLHDLRRTAVTGMSEIGIQPHIVEAVVNHVSGYKGGVAGTYNVAEYASEKRRALQHWADHISRLVGEKQDSNVITLIDRTNA